jgi:Rrf2 family protein
MRLLATEEYGLRCLLQVARHRGPGPITAPQIAQREGLGPEYVARIMRTLRASGLVTSARGASGGYHLSRPADQISLWEAIQVLGGPFISEEFCEGWSGRRRECIHDSDCAVRALWRKLEVTLRQTLERTSLQDLERDEQSMTTWLEAMALPESGQP